MASSERAAKRSRVVDDADDDDDDTFTFKYNEEGELVGTAEEEAADRTYLASLTEVERYEVLLEREYERNNAKKVWEFRQKKKESEREAASVASGGRRRGTGSGASKQKKALEKLQANRKRQKARSSRRGDDDEEDEWDDEEDEEDDVSSIDNDEEYEAEAPSRSRKGQRSAAAAPEDGMFGDDLADDDEDAAEATLDEIQQIRLSRHKLEKWCHEPFFDDLVEGCFVRIGIGTSNETSQPVYRCAEIVRVDSRQPYTFGNTKTRKALRLRHGDQERSFRMEFVSNAPFEPSEFRKWREAMADNDLQLATRGQVERKLKAIEEAKNFKHGTDHVRKIVEEKQKAGASVGNSAIRISTLDMLIGEKDDLLERMHAEEQDPEEIGRVYEERKALIDEREMIKRKAEELRQDRQSQYSKINDVNKRNIERNLTAKKAQKRIDPESERRAKAPMVVSLQMHGTEKKESAEDKKAAERKAEDEEAEKEEAAKLAAPRRNSTKELLEAHQGISIDIDVPLDFDMPSLPPAAPAPAQKTPVRKGLGFLAAYKEAKGLI